MPSQKPSIHGFIIDPDRTYAQNLCVALTGDGNLNINLEYCENTSQCTDQLRKSSGGVILLGVGSINSPALDLISRVRAMNPTIAILALTDRFISSAAIQCVTRGAQDCLSKQDVSADVIRHAVELAVQRQRISCDLTARHETLAAKLARNDERRQQNQRFIRTVSHDLRTPLTVISEFASLLQDGLVGDSPLDEKQQHFLRVIRDRSDELNTMVGNLLDATKIESQCLPLWRKPCKFADSIEMIEANLQTKAKVNQVDLLIGIDCKIPQIFADDDTVQRMLNNLLSYAIQTCDAGGFVDLTAAANQAGSDLVVTITNSQAKLDADLATTLTSSITRQTLPSNCKGNALSLRIASEIAFLNFGDLKGEILPGRGAEFTLTIPLVNAEAIAARFQQRLKNDKSLAIAEIRNGNDQCNCDDEINALLHLALEPTDLLIPISQGRSLLLIPTNNEALRPDASIAAYQDRFEQVLADVNRRRGREKLKPRLKIERLHRFNDTATHEAANPIRTPIPSGFLAGVSGAMNHSVATVSTQFAATSPNCTT